MTLWAWVKQKLNAVFGRATPDKTDITDKTKRKSARRNKNHYGAHYYLGDLLDQIDGTFAGLRLLKKHSRDDYNLFSQTGITACNSDVLTTVENNGWVDFNALPAFGAFHMGGGDVDGDKVACKLIFFNKIKRPYNVQPSNHTIYMLSLVYELRGKPAFFQIFVAVDTLGNINPLKMCHPKYFGFKRNSSQQDDGFMRMTWDWPDGLKEVARAQGEDVIQCAKWLFWSALNMSMTSSSGITVRVKKKKDVATFAIDMERTPYFFADRDKVANHNGQTKKIFHIVRGHRRNNANGTTTSIRTHFRGLRKFTWNGYEVLVSLNGKNNIDIFDITIPSYNENDICPKDAMDNEQLGERIGKVLAAAYA